MANHSSSYPRIDQADGHVFTYEYAQPAEYHYCQDSIIFPLFVAKHLKAHSPLWSQDGHAKRELRALDVCAGCGVIGLELAHYLPEISRFDFIEIQNVFRESFLRNIEITRNNPENFRFLQENYDVLKTDTYLKAYDLIVANPPYFLAHQGRLSPSSQVKNRCRFFLDSTLDQLIHGLLHALKPDGSAYVLIKSGARHGRNAIDEIQAWVAEKACAQIVADIRGTLVLQLSKQISKSRHD